MLFLVGVSWVSHILNLTIMFVGFVLMFIILLQRGKGGGLAGAFGGAGGSTPFGARSVEGVTKLTAGIALFWAILIVSHCYVAQWDGGEKQRSALAGGSGSP